MASYFLPRPGSVMFYPEVRECVIPSLDKWIEIDRKEAFNNPPSGFPDSYLTPPPGSEVICLNRDGRLRISACAGIVLIDDRGPRLVLGQFDDGHPRMPGLLTVPGGAVEKTDASLPAAVVREAFEEVLFIEGGLALLPSSHDAHIQRGIQAAYPHITALMPLSYYQKLEFEWLTDGKGLRTIAMWPECDSLECCYFLYTRVDNSFELVDGEVLPNGARRGTPVITIGPTEQLPGKATPKTDFFFERFQVHCNDGLFDKL